MDIMDTTLDMNLAHDWPALYALAMALPAALPGDGKAHDAALRALTNLRAAPAIVFDGAELRVISASRRADGVWQVTDGVDCTCEGRRHAYCWHRLAFRLLTALYALRDPAALHRAIIAQAVPLEQIAELRDPRGCCTPDAPCLVDRPCAAHWADAAAWRAAQSGPATADLDDSAYAELLAAA